MGNQNTTTYARFIEGTQKPGFTGELVSNQIEDPSKLVTCYNEGVDTMSKAFKRTVERFPDNNFLGTRDEKQEGRPYVWKSYKTCD